MNPDCNLGNHFITWTAATAVNGPPPGLYYCHWCGVPIPIHLECTEEEEMDRWKLYESMKQNYELSNGDQE